MATLVDLLQPVAAEYTRIRGFGDGGFLYHFHSKLLLFQKAADHDASRLVTERRHLEVKVTGQEEQWVDGGKVDDNLVPQTQRPALTEEETV